MIGLSCTADAVLALCGQVRGTLERKGLPQKELDGGRVRIEPRYNQGSGFGLVPLNGRQMAPLSLAALWALLAAPAAFAAGISPFNINQARTLNKNSSHSRYILASARASSYRHG